METTKHSIRLVESGLEFLCSEDEFLFKAMMRYPEAPVHHGCCGGGCGQCKMQVESGTYDVVKPMSRAHVSEKEEQNGIVLTCCVKPSGDMVLSQVQ